MKYVIIILLLFTGKLIAQNSTIDLFSFPDEYNSKLFSHQLIYSINNKLSLNKNYKTHFVYLYFDSIPDSKQEIELNSLGAKLYRKSGIPAFGNHPYAFILAKINIENLKGILQLNYIKKIADAEGKCFPQSNVSARLNKTDSVNYIGYTGNSVKMAFLDSGLDLGYKSDELPQNIIAFDYSSFPDSMDMEVYNKVTGHGTHVVGCAMAKGVLSDKNSINGGGAYKGGAPNAGLIFLKIGNDIDASCTIKAMQGAAIDAATDYGANLVSLSYGMVDDYNDGSSSMEQTIDWIASKGIPFICSAGNSRHWGEHYSETLTSGATSDFIQVDLNKSVFSANPSLNLVWAKSDSINDFDIYYYDNKKQAISDTYKYSVTKSTRNTCSMVSYAFIKNSLGLNQYYIRVKNNSKSSKRFHLNLYNKNNVSNTEYSSFANPDSLYTILWPSTADSAFCVGSYVSRNTWIDSDGNENKNNVKVGAISNYSSCGPRIDETQKLDIVAPGESIISLRDRSIYNIPSDKWIDNDGAVGGVVNYYIMKGTSMSAPFVSSAVALILSRSPKAKPFQIYSALRKSAIRDTFTKNNINYIAGWGKLNAYSAINSSEIPEIINVATQTNTICGSQTFKVRVYGTAEFNQDNNFTIQISDANGSFISPTVIGFGKLDESSEIICQINSDLPSSSKYRLRAISSSPELISAYSERYLTYSPEIKQNIFGPPVTCHSINYKYSTEKNEYIENKWIVTGGTIQKQSNDEIEVLWVAPNSGKIKLISKNILTDCKDSIEKEIRIRITPSAQIVGNFVTCDENEYIYTVGVRKNEKAYWEVVGGQIIDSAYNYLSIHWLNSDTASITVRVTDDTCDVTKSYEITNLPSIQNSIQGEKNVFKNCVYEYYTKLSNKVYNEWVISGGYIVDSTAESIKIRWKRDGVAGLKLKRNSETCSYTHEISINISNQFKANLIGALTVCQGSIEKYICNDLDTAEYSWSINNGEIIEKNNNNITVKWKTPGNGIIRLIKTKSLRNYVDTVNYKVNIIEIPIVTLESFPVFCSNSPSYILKEGKPNGGNYFGKGVVNNVFYPDSIINGNSEIKYIYKNANNCIDSAKAIIYVHQTAETPALIRRNDTLFAQSESKKFKWYYNLTEILDENLSYLYPKKNGIYNVSAVNEFLCESDLSDSILVDNTSIKGSNFGKYKLSPNPVTDVLIVEQNNNLQTTFTISDMQGRKIIIDKIMTQNKKIDLSECGSGVYSITFESGNLIERYWFIKL